MVDGVQALGAVAVSAVPYPARAGKPGEICIEEIEILEDCQYADVTDKTQQQEKFAA